VIVVVSLNAEMEDAENEILTESWFILCVATVATHVLEEKKGSFMVAESNKETMSHIG